MAWTEERWELCKRLWLNGLSASQIAVRLGGVTRNGVIGKLYRSGLTRGDGDTSRSLQQKLRPTGFSPTSGFTFGRAGLASRQKGAPTDPPRSAGAPTPFSTEITDLAPDFMDPAYRNCVDLLDAVPGQCRFPIGDPVKFCGRKTCDRGSGSYCEAHAGRVYAHRSGAKWAKDDPRRAAFRARARRYWQERKAKKEHLHG